MNDDLISRQAVLDLLFNKYIKTELTSIGYANKEYAELCVDELNELPSVNPQEPKTGHWNVWDTSSFDWTYKCDKCGYIVRITSNYCPNCGARMVKPQETQESDHKCHTCKHYVHGEHDGSCGSYICKGYSNWESEDEE